MILDTSSVSTQKRVEMVKAFAYGETIGQVAEAEGLPIDITVTIANEEHANIQKEHDILQKAGYINE